jgi:energy-coupling factor transporter ATP-binding protein EcfA2
MPDIRSITIRRFKLLQDVSLRLDYSNVFVGGNNSGKSSILQALHFAVSVAQSARLATDAIWQNDTFRATFRPEQLIYTPTTEFRSLGFNRALRERRDTWIEVEIQQIDDTRCGIAIGPARNGNIALLMEGQTLGERVQDISRPYTVYAPGLAGIAREETLLSQGVVRRFVARGDANLVLRNVLLWLFRHGGWEQFVNDLKELFPQIRLRIDFTEITDEHIRASFDLSNLGINLPLESAGTGVLQAIQVLAYITLFKPRLLLLDEPDSHMHPNNQAALCKLLLHLARERDFQVMIATHSRHVFSATRDTVPITWVSAGTIVEGVTTESTARLLEIGALDSLDFLGNPNLRCVVLTEDTDTTMLKSLLRASGFDLGQTLIAPYNGCTKIDAVIVVSQLLRDKAPNLRLVVHRDRDYMSPDESTTYTTRLAANGCSVFLTDFSDVEGYFLNRDHIHNLYPQITMERAGELIEQATALTRDASITDIINLRTERALRKRNQTGEQFNAGAIALAAQHEYDADTTTMRRGKRVIGSFKALLQQELGANPKLDGLSTALSITALRTIATAVWPPAAAGA